MLSSKPDIGFAPKDLNESQMTQVGAPVLHVKVVSYMNSRFHL